jgi:hypothetical protein
LKTETREFCLPKHLITLGEGYCLETIPMTSDQSLKDTLMQIKNGAADLRREYEEAQEAGREPPYADIAQFARDARKAIEPYLFRYKQTAALKQEEPRWCLLNNRRCVKLQQDAFSYTLEKTHSPRTGLTSVQIQFTPPKDTLPTLWIDLPKDEQDTIASSIAEIATRLGYTISKPDKRGNFYLTHNVPGIPTIVMDMANFGFITKEGYLTSPSEEAIENALREAVIIAGVKDRTKFATGGTLLPEKRKEEVIKGVPVTRRITIKEVCPGGESKCSYDITIKDEFKRKREDVAVSPDELARKVKDALALPDSVRLAILKADPLLTEIASQLCTGGICFARGDETDRLPICSPSEAKALERCITRVKAKQPKYCEKEWHKPPEEMREGCYNPFAICRASVGCRLGGVPKYEKRIES